MVSQSSVTQNGGQGPASRPQRRSASSARALRCTLTHCAQHIRMNQNARSAAEAHEGAPHPAAAAAQPGPGVEPWTEMSPEELTALVAYVLSVENWDFDTSALREAPVPTAAFGEWMQGFTTAGANGVFADIQILMTKERMRLASPVAPEGLVAADVPGAHSIRGSLGTVVRRVSVGTTAAVRKSVLDATSWKCEVGAYNHLMSRRGSERFIVQYIGHVAHPERTDIFLEAAETMNADAVIAAGADFKSKAAMALCLAEAVAFIHRNGVLHRDIALRNLLRVRGRWVLSDFGFARVPAIHSTESKDLVDLLRFKGLHDATAPESITRGEFDARTDIHMLGCALMHIFTSVPRYTLEVEGVENPQVQTKIITMYAREGAIPKNLLAYEANCKDETNRAIQHLIRQCISIDPEERPFAADVVELLRLALEAPKTYHSMTRRTDDAKRRRLL
jgi:hypothetical protein